METFAVEEDRAHPDRGGAFDVVGHLIADHRGLGGLDLEQVEHGAEDRGVRFRAAVVEGADPRVDVERVVAGELADVASRVRDEADAKAGGANAANVSGTSS